MVLASGTSSKARHVAGLRRKKCWLESLLTRETSVSLIDDGGWENSGFPFLLTQGKRAFVFSLETLKLVLEDATTPNYNCSREVEQLMTSFLVEKGHLKLPLSYNSITHLK
jgi:hypothetical protein